MRRRAQAVRILQDLAELPFGPGAARRFTPVMHQLDRAGHPISAIDGMIAAVALEQEATILSRNRRDFQRVPGLDILAP